MLIKMSKYVWNRNNLTLVYDLRSKKKNQEFYVTLREQALVSNTNLMYLIKSSKSIIHSI